MKIRSTLSTTRRRAATLATATAVVACAALTVGSAPALADDAVPSYDFSDCPPIPPGADPAQWRCEVLTAGGSLTFGKVSLPELAPMTITHAEGPMPDGTPGQVWGALRSRPTTVPGGLPRAPGGDRARALGLALQPEYGGSSDFYSDADNMGMFTMRFGVQSPLLPAGCTIGADSPVVFHLKRSGSSQWLSSNPPLIKFAAYDDAFAVPAATGCGPLGRVLNDRLGLPSSSGNLVTYSAYYTFKTYDQLPAR